MSSLKFQDHLFAMVKNYNIHLCLEVSHTKIKGKIQLFSQILHLFNTKIDGYKNLSPKYLCFGKNLLDCGHQKQVIKSHTSFKLKFRKGLGKVTTQDLTIYQRHRLCGGSRAQAPSKIILWGPSPPRNFSYLSNKKSFYI